MRECLWLGSFEFDEGCVFYELDYKPLASAFGKTPLELTYLSDTTNEDFNIGNIVIFRRI